ncbi:hypothetical protein HYC85_023999 [Camellia sinensis]|uniref:Uncharacterized protein n=1 Tax=Camellia sinensis TaxID=4442 RepID=A0A7J7GG53_CAMSI|nr:hypothetical protein HYC85_023999 [Camellia sinensis]
MFGKLERWKSYCQCIENVVRLGFHVELFSGRDMSSSKIAVQSVHNTNKDLIWSPLSTNNSGSSQAWVSLGHSQGIVSLSGFHHSHPTYFEFTVLIQPHGSQHAEMKSAEMISWGDENFHTGETHLQNSEVNESTASKWSAETIVNEIALFWESLKIGKLMLARLLTAHDAMMSYDKTPETCKMVHSEKVKELYSDLMTLDPPHSQYYKDEYSLVVLKQLTFSLESLLRHCCHYRDSASSGTNTYICLRLITTKWVVSLEPLKLLKSLKVLDISYNEIGADAVDTRRYLCSSPLSHTVGSDWNLGEFAISGVNVTFYGEAFVIFKDLKLTQLDIIGNVVVEEEF